GDVQLFDELVHALLLDGVERHCVHARRPLVALHPLPRFPQDVTPVDAVVQRVESALPLLLGCFSESLLQLSHFGDGLTPAGVVGPALAGHALALTCTIDLTTAGTLRSGRVVRRGHRHYYDPLGLPLRGA